MTQAKAWAGLCQSRHRQNRPLVVPRPTAAEIASQGALFARPMKQSRQHMPTVLSQNGLEVRTLPKRHRRASQQRTNTWVRATLLTSTTPVFRCPVHSCHRFEMQAAAAFVHGVAAGNAATYVVAKLDPAKGHLPLQLTVLGPGSHAVADQLLKLIAVWKNPVSLPPVAAMISTISVDELRAVVDSLLTLYGALCVNCILLATEHTVTVVANVQQTGRCSRPCRQVQRAGQSVPEATRRLAVCVRMF